MPLNRHTAGLRACAQKLAVAGAAAAAAAAAVYTHIYIRVENREIGPVDAATRGISDFRRTTTRERFFTRTRAQESGNGVFFFSFRERRTRVCTKG